MKGVWRVNRQTSEEAARPSFEGGVFVLGTGGEIPCHDRC